MKARPKTDRDCSTPRLDELGVSHEERAALCTQGFVSEEWRGNRRYFKLRFRCRDRQRVKYLGSCAQRAEQVRVDLQELQRWHHWNRDIARFTKQARILMHKTKVQLRPVLERKGYHFYGNEIRRRRSEDAIASIAPSGGAGE